MTEQERILNWFTPQYEKFRILGGAPPHLCAWDDIVALRKPSHASFPHPILYEINTLQLECGFTGNEIEEITASVIAYLERNPQCQLASPHYRLRSFQPCSLFAHRPGTKQPSSFSPTPASE
ncbi:MAG: hypothetical protein U9N44_00815 [Chloroflexota bacterium]|nr:hypothetical protein [Chloroflexota bacterium]